MNKNYNHRGYKNNKNNKYYHSGNKKFYQLDSNNWRRPLKSVQDQNDLKDHSDQSKGKKLSLVNCNNVSEVTGVINESETGIQNVRSDKLNKCIQVDQGIKSLDCQTHTYRNSSDHNKYIEGKRIMKVSTDKAKEYFEHQWGDMFQVRAVNSKHPHEYLAGARYILESYLIIKYDNLRIYDIGAGRRNLTNTNVWSNTPRLCAEDNLRHLDTLNLKRKFNFKNNCSCNFIDCNHVKEFQPDILISVDSSYYEGVSDEILKHASQGLSSFCIFNVFDLARKGAQSIIVDGVKQGCYEIQNGFVNMQVIGNPTPYVHRVHPWNDLFNVDNIRVKVSDKNIKVMKVREFDFNNLKYVLCFVTLDINYKQQEHEFLNNKVEHRVQTIIEEKQSRFKALEMTCTISQTFSSLIKNSNENPIKVSPFKTIANNVITRFTEDDFKQKLDKLEYKINHGKYIFVNSGKKESIYIYADCGKLWLGSQANSLYLLDFYIYNRIETKIRLALTTANKGPNAKPIGFDADDVLGTITAIKAGNPCFMIPDNVLILVITALMTQIIAEREAVAGLVNSINKKIDIRHDIQNAVTKTKVNTVNKTSDMYAGIDIRPLSEVTPCNSQTEIPVKVHDSLIYEGELNIFKRTYNKLIKMFIKTLSMYRYRMVPIGVIASTVTGVLFRLKDILSDNNYAFTLITALPTIISAIHALIYGKVKMYKRPIPMDICSSNVNSERFVNENTNKARQMYGDYRMIPGKYITSVVQQDEDQHEVDLDSIMGSDSESEC